MKKIVLSVLMLGLAAVLFGASTYAWFSMNKSVSASNMAVKAKTDASLLIGQAIPSYDSNSFSVSFGEEASSPNELYNSTHDEATAYQATNLKTVSNPGDVSSSTGANTSGKTLSYVVAENTTTKAYYKDYIVYVATVGEDITGQTLKLDLSASLGTEGTIKDLNKAITIDVYYVASTTTTMTSSQIQAGTYAKNIAVEDAGVNSITIDATIPATAQGAPKAMAILLRVYLDGDRVNPTTGKKYVNTGDILNIQSLLLEVNMEVVKFYEVAVDTWADGTIETNNHTILNAARIQQDGSMVLTFKPSSGKSVPANADQIKVTGATKGAYDATAGTLVISNPTGNVKVEIDCLTIGTSECDKVTITGDTLIGQAAGSQATLYFVADSGKTLPAEGSVVVTGATYTYTVKDGKATLVLSKTSGSSSVSVKVIAE